MGSAFSASLHKANCACEFRCSSSSKRSLSSWFCLSSLCTFATSTGELGVWASNLFTSAASASASCVIRERAVFSLRISASCLLLLDFACFSSDAFAKAKVSLRSADLFNASHRPFIFSISSTFAAALASLHKSVTCSSLLRASAACKSLWHAASETFSISIRACASASLRSKRRCNASYLACAPSAWLANLDLASASLHFKR
mmetsp:Transcript_82988/g.177886  ORF Transcript_82988/g.177886 Transcript_82988/m.177886 type:complete len:203 (+) Transcript_82988:662-1270(+)